MRKDCKEQESVVVELVGPQQFGSKPQLRRRAGQSSRSSQNAGLMAEARAVSTQRVEQPPAAPETRPSRPARMLLLSSLLNSTAKSFFRRHCIVPPRCSRTGLSDINIPASGWLVPTFARQKLKFEHPN